MKSTLLLLIFFQLSVYAQTNTKNQDSKKKLYFTLINGKGSANLKLTRNEIIDASITLKGKEDNETIPVIKALEMYIPGYPEIYVDGNMIDRETASKILKTKTGDVIVIKPKTEIDSWITTMTIEIIE
jgi:hypothetical protein